MTICNETISSLVTKFWLPYVLVKKLFVAQRSSQNVTLVTKNLVAKYRLRQQNISSQITLVTKYFISKYNIVDVKYRLKSMILVTKLLSSLKATKPNNGFQLCCYPYLNSRPLVPKLHLPPLTHLTFH